jgi:hypothetical protein
MIHWLVLIVSNAVLFHKLTKTPMHKFTRELYLNPSFGLIGITRFHEKLRELDIPVTIDELKHILASLLQQKLWRPICTRLRGD